MRANQVAVAVKHMQEQAAADKDVIDDLMDEIQDLRNCEMKEQPASNPPLNPPVSHHEGDKPNGPNDDGSNGTNDPPSGTPPQTNNGGTWDNDGGGLTAQASKEESEDPYIVYVRSHYAAFGYNDKTHMSARSSIMKWRHVSKTRKSFDECLDIVDNQYLGRKDMFPWLSKIQSSLQSWWYDKATWLQVSAIVAATGVTTIMAFRDKRVRAVTAVASVGVLGMLYHNKKSSMRVTKNTVVKSYCTQMDTNATHTIDQGAKLSVPDVSRQKCVGKTLPVGFTFGMPYLWVPSHCIHNELNALVTRQLQARLPMTDEGLHALDIGLAIINKHLAPVVNPHSKAEQKAAFLAKCPPARRMQIMRAMVNDIVVDTRVAGFPKIEVMTGKPCWKRKVRFISGFSDGYLGETGPEYYMWQKCMIKHYWSDPIQRQFMKLVYTGGMKADEIGDWFGSRIALARIFVLLDFGKFDSRNKKELIQRLMDFYEKHLSPELMQWLYDTFNKTGKTSLGIQFSVEATVASGRIDTSFGNTLLVFMLVLAMFAMMSHRYLKDMDISALGDDNNSSLTYFYHDMNDIKRVSGYLGHEADGMIIRPGQYHLIEYCSQRLWQVSPGQYVLGPKIGRLLTKTFVCHKHVPADKLVDHISGVIQGFKNYRWLPLFRSVYAKWMLLHPKPGKKYYDDNNPHKMQLTTELTVDPECIRQQFIFVYGFDPTQLEEELLALPYDMGDSYEHPLINSMLETDGVSYTYEPEDYFEWSRQCTQGPVSEYILQCFL